MDYHGLPHHDPETLRWIITDLSRRVKQLEDHRPATAETLLGRISTPTALAIIGIVATWRPQLLDSVVRLLLGH